MYLILPITIDNSMQAMCYRKYSRFLKALSYSALYECVGLVVDTCGGFIQDYMLRIYMYMMYYIM